MPPFSKVLLECLGQMLSDAYSVSELQAARRSLSAWYRQDRPPSFKEPSRLKKEKAPPPHALSTSLLQDERTVLAYAATRMPATYAVCVAVFNHLLNHLQGRRLSSILDLGSGPGTVLWASHALFPELAQVTCVEGVPACLHLAQTLWTTRDGHNANGPTVTWIQSDLASAGSTLPTSPHDLVSLSYVMGEIPPHQRHVVLDYAWQRALSFCVLIEPGTPRGFEALHWARQWLIQRGAFIVAPCPHAKSCPMMEAGHQKTPQDWCHFSQRVERNAHHRRLKESSLMYEDEKYCYLIVSKNPVKSSLSRIVKKPFSGKGHVTLDVCTQHGLKRFIVSKTQGSLYKSARSFRWGDESPLSLDDPKS